jgi:hypothetical protein
VAAGELRFGERANHPSFDDLLRLLHPLQLLPKTGADRVAAELGERAGRRCRRRKLALETAAIVAAKAALPQMLGKPFVLSSDRRELGDARLRGARLKLIEEPLDNSPLVRPSRMHRQPIDPGRDGRADCQRRADQQPSRLGDQHNRSLIAQQTDRLVDREPVMGRTLGSRSFPKLHQAPKIIGSVVTDQNLHDDSTSRSLCSCLIVAIQPMRLLLPPGCRIQRGPTKIPDETPNPARPPKRAPMTPHEFVKPTYLLSSADPMLGKNTRTVDQDPLTDAQARTQPHRLRDHLLHHRIVQHPSPPRMLDSRADSAPPRVVAGVTLQCR